MPKRVWLPKDAFEDVRSLVILDKQKLQVLTKYFAKGEAASNSTNQNADNIVQLIGAKPEEATNLAFIVNFLLNVTGDGITPDEVVRDIFSFLNQYSNDNDEVLKNAIQENKTDFLALVSPSPERLRAKKIGFLEGLRPNATSFRTVCELRPIFEEHKSDEEMVTGFIPVVSLLAEITENDEEKRLILQLSPESLVNLRMALDRAFAKLEILKKQYGSMLVTDNIDQ